nr:hypothetical protein [Rhizobium sp. N122]
MFEAGVGRTIGDLDKLVPYGRIGRPDVRRAGGDHRSASRGLNDRP